MRVYTGLRSFDVVDVIFNAVTGVSAAFIVSLMDGLIAVALGPAETWLWNNGCGGRGTGTRPLGPDRCVQAKSEIGWPGVKFLLHCRRRGLCNDRCCEGHCRPRSIHPSGLLLKQGCPKVPHVDCRLDREGDFGAPHLTIQKRSFAAVQKRRSMASKPPVLSDG